MPANLTVHVSALRRTLRDGRDGNRFIINIPARGYSFVGPVEASENSTRAVAGDQYILSSSWQDQDRRPTRVASADRRGRCGDARTLLAMSVSCAAAR